MNHATASPKNTFDREPLLIPQIVAEGKPWHRRPGTVLRIVLAVLLIVLITAVVWVVTPERILTAYANLVS